MNRWPALVLASALLYGGAAWSASIRGAPVGWGRDLVRPMMLPFLWRSLADAEHRGAIGEEIGKARLLMQLLPRWTDGHIVFAYRLALHAAPAGAEGAIGRLQAAVHWMDEARANCPSDREIELLEAMAFLIELATERDPEMAAALDAQGTPAAPWADRILAQAEQVSDSAALRERRIFTAPRLMAHFLRLRDMSGVSSILERTLERLSEVRDQELAGRWQQSLLRLRSFLRGDRLVERADLLQDPLLADLAPFLP